MDSLLQDLKHGLRILLKNPGFTIVAALTLALGIGASTAIFSVFNAVLLKPLPYPEPERIMQVWQVGEDGGRMQFSGQNFHDLRDASRSFEALALYARSPMVVVPNTAEPLRVQGAVVSDDFFRVIGTQPVAGRTLVPEEFQQGGPRAALVSESFWREQFGSAPSLRGSALTLGDTVYSVVGVLPDGREYPPQISVWLPTRGQELTASRTGHNWRVIGRLREGVSLAQAREEVASIAARLRAQHGQDTWMVNAALVPLREQMVGTSRPALLVLLGSVALLLLIACANLVHLLLRQAATRRREIALRAALGASGGRVARHCITESAVLVFLGAALGMLVAVWGTGAILALEPGRLPRSAEVGLDIRVALFAVGVSLLIALVLGAMTARHAMRFELLESLKSGGHQASERSGGWIRGGLIVSQVAFTLVLVVAAGLLARSFIQLISVDPGFRTESVLTAELSHPYPRERAQRERLSQAHHELIQRLAAAPGIEAAGGINLFPLSGGAGSSGQFLIMHPSDVISNRDDFIRLWRQNPDRLGSADYRVASGGYFKAMGIPLVRGRLFDERDGPDAPHVALISESLARQQWPGEDPLGKVIQFGNMDGDLRPFTIVGIVGDVRDASLAGEVQRTFYGHYRQRTNFLQNFTLVVRGRGGPAMLAPTVRQLAREVQPTAPVSLRAADEIVAASVSERRFQLTLLAAFGGTALFLALVGIYGVTSYSVAQRKQEIGVRMALGAQPQNILALVLSSGMRYVLLGIVLGLTGAILLTRFLQTLLFGVAPHDPLTLAGVSVGMALVAALASYIPARRATAIDPVVALRYE